MSKRIPDSMRCRDVTVKKAFLLLQQLWNKDYIYAWDTIDSQWHSKVPSDIIHKLCHSLRECILDLVMHAFKTIEVCALSRLLHLGEDEATACTLVRSTFTCVILVIGFGCRNNLSKTLFLRHLV